MSVNKEEKVSVSRHRMHGRRQLPSASAQKKHPSSFNLDGIVSATNIGGKFITPGYAVKLPIR